MSKTTVASSMPSVGWEQREISGDTKSREGISHFSTTHSSPIFSLADLIYVANKTNSTWSRLRDWFGYLYVNKNSDKI